MGPCCEQTHAAFEVGLSLDHGRGVYRGWSDVDGSSQLRLCHTCILDAMSAVVRVHHKTNPIDTGPKGAASHVGLTGPVSVTGKIHFVKFLYIWGEQK